MLLAADNLQITNRIIEKAVKDLNPRPIQAMIKKCEAAGADAIDINSGPLSRDPEKKMTFLVESVQEVTNLPLLLDTTNPKALKAGLEISKNKTIINGFSLEPAKLEFILPLAKKYDTDIIGYLLYPNSHVPHDESERLNIAVELYREFQKADINDKHLIIDPVIAPVMWENGNIQDIEILSVIRNLPDLLGFPVKTIAGISNLTTGAGPKDKKLILEKTYVSMLAAAGLSIALMNIFHSDTVQTARACNSLQSKQIFTWEAV